MKDVRVAAGAKLRLARETLRRLSHGELAQVRGGSEANLELVAEVLGRTEVGCPAPAPPPC